MTVSRPDAGSGPPGPIPFQLLETLKWEPATGFFLLERHVDRLASSARALGFACPIPRVHQTLNDAVAHSDVPLRVRLLVSSDGSMRTEAAPLQESSSVLRVALAAAPIDPADPFLYHKTTNRDQQDRQRSAAFDDVILWNPAGDITESSIGNIVIEIDGRLVTPPVECGLLAGTFRAELLASGEISEARVSVGQLRAASRLWLINSVRGWQPVVLAPS